MNEEVAKVGAEISDDLDTCQDIAEAAQDLTQATTSAYRVDIRNHDATSWTGPVMYEVRTSGPDGADFLVWHRYNDFRQLERYLRFSNPQLPCLPGQAGLQKWYDASSVIAMRKRLLCILLRRAISADPNLDDVPLRHFLGVVRESEDPRLFGARRDDAPFNEVQHAHNAQAFTTGVSDNRIDEESESPPSLWRAQSSLVDYGREHSESPVSASLCSCTPRRRAHTDESTPVSGLRKRCSLVEVLGEEEASRRVTSFEDDSSFHEFAVVIARDVARVFPGDPAVDSIRLKIAETLRAYARKDPVLGYTQGMCFAATVVCMGDAKISQPRITRSLTAEIDDDSYEAQRDLELAFEQLMHQLRPLWEPNFPWIYLGIPIMESLLARDDPEMFDHFRSNLTLDLDMIIPVAWISAFAKWLPLAALVDIVPFLGREALVGFVTVTFLVLLSHRDRLLAIDSLDEMLPFVNNLCNEKPPDNLIQMCQISAPRLRVLLSQAT